jgi:hypothetical protein
VLPTAMVYSIIKRRMEKKAFFSFLIVIYKVAVLL